MKRCGKCCVEKNESEFHKSKRRPDGLGNRCKSCKSLEHKEYIAKYPEKHKEKYTNYLANWRLENKDKCKEYAKKTNEKKYTLQPYRSPEEIEFIKKMSEKNQIEWKELSHERKKEWKKKYRDTEDVKLKNKARHTLQNAVLSEKIRRPNKCEICNLECKPEGHHIDYSKPLYVMWLCHTCHEKQHGKLKDLLEQPISTTSNSNPI